MIGYHEASRHPKYHVRSEPRQIIQPRGKSFIRNVDVQSSPNSVFAMPVLPHSESEATFGSTSSTTLSDSIATRASQKVPMQELAHQCERLISQIDHAHDIHGVTLEHPGLRNALLERKSVLSRAEDPRNYLSYMRNTRGELHRAKAGLLNAAKGAQAHAASVKTRASEVYGMLIFSAQRARVDSDIDNERLNAVIGGNRDLTRESTKTEKFFGALNALHAAKSETASMNSIRRLQAALTARDCGSISEFLLPNTVANAISPEVLDIEAATHTQAVHADRLLQSIMHPLAKGRFPVDRDVKMKPALLHKGVSLVLSKIAYFMAMNSDEKLQVLLSEIHPEGMGGLPHASPA